MVVSLLGQVYAKRRLAKEAARRRTADQRDARAELRSERQAERARRFAAALDQRDAARAERTRRWGPYVCHMPSDPYDS